MLNCAAMPEHLTVEWRAETPQWRRASMLRQAWRALDQKLDGRRHTHPALPSGVRATVEKRHTGTARVILDHYVVLDSEGHGDYFANRIDVLVTDAI